LRSPCPSCQRECFWLLFHHPQVTRLPGFVRRVSALAWTAKPAHVLAWNATTDDARALARPPDEQQRDPTATVAARITSSKQASFTVDVVVDADALGTTTGRRLAYNVSLYCVDFAREGIAQNVRVTKLSSRGDHLEVLEDLVVLRSFENGAYLTYEVGCDDARPDALCGSLRFRVFEMYDAVSEPFGFPPKPVLSGIFFD